MRGISGTRIHLALCAVQRQPSLGNFVVADLVAGRTALARDAAILSGDSVLIGLVAAWLTADHVVALVNAIRRGRVAEGALPRPFRGLSTYELGVRLAAAMEAQQRPLVDALTVEAAWRERSAAVRVDGDLTMLADAGSREQDAFVRRQARTLRPWVRGELARRRAIRSSVTARTSSRVRQRQVLRRRRPRRARTPRLARAPDASDGDPDPAAGGPRRRIAIAAETLARPRPPNISAGPDSCPPGPCRRPIKSADEAPPKAGGAPRSLLNGLSAASRSCPGPALGLLAGAP
jgi:hypothetical protein